VSLSERIRAAGRARAAVPVPRYVLVVGDSAPHTRTVTRVGMPAWRERSLARAARDGRSPFSADAPISGGESL